MEVEGHIIINPVLRSYTSYKEVEEIYIIKAGKFKWTKGLFCKCVNPVERIIASPEIGI